MAVRVATIHRHRLFQDCLRDVLSRERRYRVIDIDAADADPLALIQAAAADVVIVDAALPASRAVELIRAIRLQFASARVLVIASASDKPRLVECIEAGAHGCMLDESSVEDLKAAIDAVRQGTRYCHPRATDLIFAQLAEAAEATRSRPQLKPGTLSSRECEILELITSGCSNKEIARELNLSLYTVKNHVHRILEKLPAGSRHEAAQLAREHRWLPL